MAVPNHIAIIPDGNRRWAKARRFRPWEGHAEGVRRFWEITTSANELEVKHLTFWATSYDNLVKRSKLEIKFLLQLLEKELIKPELLDLCLRNQVKARIIGEWREFISNKKLIANIEELEQNTQHFNKKSLNILFAYDGQREMLAGINELVKAGKKVSEENLRRELWTGELPNVDLVIRTGGEPHWSAGFMMWHTANSQFYFTEQLWPDFDKQELKKAIDEFDRRERRLGK